MPTEREPTVSAGQALLSKTRTGLGALRYLPAALALTWQAARRWTLLWLGLLLLQGILPAASVQLTRIVVDRLLEASRGTASFATYSPVLWLLVLYGPHDGAGTWPSCAGAVAPRRMRPWAALAVVRLDRRTETVAVARPERTERG